MQCIMGHFRSLVYNWYSYVAHYSLQADTFILKIQSPYSVANQRCAHWELGMVILFLTHIIVKDYNVISKWSA